MSFNNPTQHLKDYCSIQGIDLGDDPFHLVTEKKSTNNLKNPLEEQTPTTSNEIKNVDKAPVNQQVEVKPINSTVENPTVINSVPTNQNNNQINNISNISNIDVLDII